MSPLVGFTMYSASLNDCYGDSESRRRSISSGVGPPQQRVRIKQQPHGMYSANPSKCSSSSTDRLIIPLQLPGTRGLIGAASLPINVATGRWFSVMMISSPGRELMHKIR